MLYPDNPMLWSRIYCKAVDTLFEKSMIWWKIEDKRGKYYSTVMITIKGKKEYERLINENAVKDTIRV